MFIIIVFFLICSTSLYWYDYANKTRKHGIEMENKAKWERDTMQWQKDVTNNINGLKQSQQQVIGVINANVMAGRLIMPKQENKP